MIKIAINGFGRIGRVAFRAALERYSRQVKVVAINTSGSMESAGWAHLLKYDTVYGQFKKTIKSDADNLIVDGKKYPLLAQREPAKIPWEDYDVNVVLESTGVFRTSRDCQGHLRAGAKKVIISAPAKDETPTYLVGVNAQHYRREEIISNGSCTTNCIAPIIQIMKENFKVVKVVMTTIHAYTADQELVDGSHQDLRRARAAAQNIVPTSTGASEALVRVLPDFEGKFAGLAIRVPVACGSLADFSFLLDQTVRVKQVNRVFDQAAADAYKGIIEVTSDPVVSSDVIGCPASAWVDLSLTGVLNGNLVKIIAWYDNEWGYACRLVELASLIGGRQTP